MRRRNVSLIAIVGMLAVAVAGSGIATATQSGSGAEAVAAKKKKKKKKKKAATSVTAQFAVFPPTADHSAINGNISGKGSCPLDRTVQAVRVDSGAVLATSETDDTNSSYDTLIIQPPLPSGTQVQVVALETKSCKRGVSPVISAP